MSEQHAASTTGLLVGACMAGGTFAVLIGLDQRPGWNLIAPLLLLIGLWLFLSRRGALAAAIRVHDSNRRLRRFKIAGVLALVTGLALVSYFWDLRDDEISTASLLLHNLVGNSAMIGAIVFTILGVLTRRDKQPQMIGA